MGGRDRVSEWVGGRDRVSVWVAEIEGGERWSE